MEMFVDTSAWIAYFNQSDGFHAQAVEVFKRKPKLLTSNLVLHETIALLENRVDRKTAKIAGEMILNPLLTRMLFISEKEENLCFKEYKKGRAKISFVDWSNFVLMKENNIKKIFAFDRDFGKMGLDILP